MNGSNLKLIAASRIKKNILQRYPELSLPISVYTVELPQERQHRLPRCGNISTPYAIDIAEDIAEDALFIEVGGNEHVRGKIVLRVPLSILALTGRRIGTIQMFDLNAFMPQFELICLQYHHITLFLESNRPFSLQVRYKHLCIKEYHLLLERTSKSYPIQQISSYEIVSEPQTNITEIIPFGKFSKGYIIECPDISQLCHLRLSLSNSNLYDIFNYGPGLLSTCTQRLSPTHLWVPFNLEVAPTPFERTAASFIGGLNHDMIDNLTFHLGFTEPQTSVKIHSFHLNTFVITGGMGAIIDEFEYRITPTTITHVTEKPTNTVIPLPSIHTSDV